MITHLQKPYVALAKSPLGLQNPGPLAPTPPLRRNLRRRHRSRRPAVHAPRLRRGRPLAVGKLQSGSEYRPRWCADEYIQRRKGRPRGHCVRAHYRGRRDGQRAGVGQCEGVGEPGVEVRRAQFGVRDFVGGEAEGEDLHFDQGLEADE